jgi:mannosyltransferase
VISGAPSSVWTRSEALRDRARSSAFGVLLARGTPVLLAALVVFLAAFRLGGKSLWHDEAFTVAVARSDDDSFRRSVLGQESFAALYYSLIRVLPPLWTDEASLRIPSVVFAGLATLACYAVSRRLFGFRVAVIATLLLAANLVVVQYAQEARAYTLALWLVTLASWTLVRAVQRPTWPAWLAYGVIATAAVYAHFFAVLVLAAHLLSLLLHRSIVPWRKVAGCAGLAAVLVLPLATAVLRTNTGGRPLLQQASIADLARELAGVPATRLGLLQAVVLALCLAAAVPAVLRKTREDMDAVQRWGYTMVACWLGVPIALAAVISLFWPIFVVRYFVVCLPALVVLVAIGLAPARARVRAVALVLVLLGSAQGLHRYYLEDYKDGENWRALVQQVAQDARPGDSVIFLSRYGRRPFEYYLARHDGLGASLRPDYPSLPWGSYPPVAGEERVDAGGDELRLEASEPDRVWVVLLWGGFRTGDDDGAPFYRTLTRDYAETDHRFFGRYLKLALYERDPS